MNNPTLNIAIQAARSAGKVIQRYAAKIDSLSVEEKSANDFVSRVDREAEHAIIDVIKTSYSDHGFIAEESGEENAEADNVWIIDPLDGTTNFLYGVPHYAVSIALKTRGKLMVAVIYDPAKDDLFTAVRGEGAYLNNHRMRVTQRPSIDGALLVTGVPFREDHEPIMDAYFKTMRALLPNTAGIRRPGAASLDLAYVAAGRYDGYWEFSLNAWDIAAGCLLVEEAGGIVSDLSGDFNHLQNGDILAASPKVYKAMVQKIKPITDQL